MPPMEHIIKAMRISNTSWSMYFLSYSPELLAIFTSPCFIAPLNLCTYSFTFISIEPVYNVRSEEHPKGEQDIKTTIYFVF